MNNKIALMYDFDSTLSAGYMQNYSLIPLLKYDTKDFWVEVNDYGKQNNMDDVLSYMFKIVEIANKQNVEITRSVFNKLGSEIKFFQGVESWFERISNFGKSLNLEVEHYIISSGMKEIIEGTSIAKHFKQIFACSYCYDENDKPYWPCQAVNYTNKTQYIFRIRKNQLADLYSSVGVNKLVEEKDKLPYSNMIYFGDGLTDIPCMKLIKSKGGHSFSVFEKDNQKAKQTAVEIYNDQRVDYIAEADYSEGSDLDLFVKNILSNISKEIEKQNKLEKIAKN